MNSIPSIALKFNDKEIIMPREMFNSYFTEPISEDIKEVTIDLLYFDFWRLTNAGPSNFDDLGKIVFYGIKLIGFYPLYPLPIDANNYATLVKLYGHTTVLRIYMANNTKKENDFCIMNQLDMCDHLKNLPIKEKIQYLVPSYLCFFSEKELKENSDIILKKMLNCH